MSEEPGEKAENFFQHKRPSKDLPDNLNGETIPRLEMVRPQVMALWDLHDRQPGIMAIHKNSLVPMSEINVGKRVSLSGSHVLTKDTHERIHEFEYSSKSLPNVMRALERHLAP